MAHQQLANHEDAKALLADAHAQMPTMRDRNPLESTKQWQDRLRCELFLEEAEELIDPAD